MLRLVGLRRRADRGGIAIEAALLVPVLLMIFVFLMAAGRLVSARGVTDAAASDGARAASISRTADTARTAGLVTVHSTLTSEGALCQKSTAQTAPVVDTTDFAPGLGAPGYVEVTVHCTVSLSDLTGLALPGSKTITSSFTSVVDGYRAR